VVAAATVVVAVPVDVVIVVVDVNGGIVTDGILEPRDCIVVRRPRNVAMEVQLTDWAITCD
jgi:hypothetical protein